MAEHSKLPWGHEPVLAHGEHNIFSGTTEIGLMYVTDGFDEPETLPAAANAALIVRAVNSHDALAKALDAAIHIINITRSPGSYTAENVLQDAERTFDEAVNALRVLALSEQNAAAALPTGEAG